MPKHALAESEYFGSGDSSRMSDNEHTAAPLRHSEPLSVKNCPGHAIPEFGERPYDRFKVSAASTREEPRYILSDNPGGAEFSNEPVILPPERATVISQTSAASCNAVRLAGESSAKNVNCWGVCDSMNVSKVLHLGPVVLQHPAGELVYLRLPTDSHPRPLRGQVEPADTGEQ